MNTLEITERFVLLVISLFILNYFINAKEKGRLNYLASVVSICTFFLCLVFTRTDISVGIGFGLFAIFSILRFRTETFSFQTTIFLFVSITLSMLDILLPLKNFEMLILVNLVLILAFLGLNFFEFKTTGTKSIEIILGTEEFLGLNEMAKKEYLKDKIQFIDFTYQIKSINFKEDKVIVKVLY